MRKSAFALVLTLLLTSCSSGAEEVASTQQKLYVPSDCTKTQILAAFPESIPNPKFIDTPWEPAEGTDLF